MENGRLSYKLYNNAAKMRLWLTFSLASEPADNFSWKNKNFKEQRIKRKHAWKLLVLFMYLIKQGAWQ